MIRILAVTAVSIGLATSAMAMDNRSQPNVPSDKTTTQMNDVSGTDNTVTNSTTGVNGANGAVGSNSSNSSTTRMGTKCAEGGANSTSTGVVTANPQTSSGSNGSGTCQ